jgi:hypothetical protein
MAKMFHEKIPVMKLYEIRQDPAPASPEWPWLCQLFGYVAHFKTKEEAEQYVESIKINRGEKKRGE